MRDAADLRDALGGSMRALRVLGKMADGVVPIVVAVEDVSGSVIIRDLRLTQYVAARKGYAKDIRFHKGSHESAVQVARATATQAPAEAAPAA